MAVAAGLAAGLELVARGREEAANLRIDGVGPALRIVPLGVGGSALARLDFGDGVVPEDVGTRVAHALGPDLREARPRLVIQRRVMERTVPVIGTAGGAAIGLELGAALAETWRHPATIDLGAGPRAVQAVRETTGTAEDGAVFVSLQEAQQLSGRLGVNDLQVFLRAGAPPSAAAARLEAAGLAAKVVLGGRGAPADVEVQRALARGRRLAQGVLALLVGLGLAVMAHLDAADRRCEIATLRAVGAGAGTVWWAIVARFVAVGGAGGLAGALAVIAFTVAQDPSAAARTSVVAAVTFFVTGACALLGALAAGPTAVAMAHRDPVPLLQEG
ncbi:MAG: hypothetical protein NDI82_12510 [Anaeromyxobacteraceae bacterium]|nr:hypothetical protein [Anaeromyxobacteraceae bacterium]